MLNVELKSQLRARGICVIIPTYNNEKSIRQVVTDTLNYCDDVIVVNDGSTDRTTATLHEIDGITLVSYPQNKGKGHALREGFRKALSMGFAFAITLDALSCGHCALSQGKPRTSWSFDCWKPTIGRS